MIHDEPIQLAPVQRVLLRNKTLATITHVVPGPEPFELLGRIEDRDGTPALWQRGGRFTPAVPPDFNPHPFDIVGIDIGDAPTSYAPFTRLTIKRLGGSS